MIKSWRLVIGVRHVDWLTLNQFYQLFGSEIRCRSIVVNFASIATVKIGIVEQELVGPSHFRRVVKLTPGLKSLLSAICPENVRSPLPKRTTFLKSTPPTRT